MRDDSTWNRLTAEQREKLESWLFDGNLGYVETLARVQKDFGVEATISSLVLEAVGADQSLDEKEKMVRVQAILFGPRRRKTQADGNEPPKNEK
jgi:hypothetical protein